jgi:hypothetical protein
VELFGWVNEEDLAGITDKTTWAAYRHPSHSLQNDVIYVKNSVKNHVFQFVVFPTRPFSKSHETEKWCRTSDTCYKQHKKQWKGHNELKCRFSDGPTKTEPR